MARAAAGSISRPLLRELRNTMAGTGSPQDRLDKIVRLIASHMVAEVCSAYLMRPNGELELFASEGLNPESVHRTRMRVGEGLVGEIAQSSRPLALSDVQSHPNFSYRPETGEEIYQSWLGVPILRADRVSGVLVVQNRTKRTYSEEEIETLETVAMVVAELVSGGDGHSELFAPDPVMAGASQRFEGLALNAGIAIGRVVQHRARATIARIVADDPETEVQRLQRALSAIQAELEDLRLSEDVSQGESRAVMEAYSMFAQDAGWAARIEEAIRGGLTAEAATDKARRDLRLRFEQIRDPYLHERLQDFEDLSWMLLQHLTGQTAISNQPLPEDMVLVARNLGPAELLRFTERRPRALVLEEGSDTGHATIIARALDIPVVGRIAGVVRAAEPGDAIVVDGDSGSVFLRPGEQVLQAYGENQRLRDSRRAAGMAMRHIPAFTRDGVRVSLNINAGMLVDLKSLAATGADGVGLFRTEIAFMSRRSYPDVAAQEAFYREVFEGAGGRPVTFRVLDAGGDKQLPYWTEIRDDNPAMGWRAMRIILDRPAMLRQQFRALIRAADGGPLHLTFPMIAEVDEFRRAREIVSLELDSLARTEPAQRMPSALHLGVMLEVPSLAFQLPTLLRNADFVSVGSNDLLQFLFASDRSNPRLVSRYDPLSPPALSFLRWIVMNCEAADRPVTLCGEIAGTPLTAMAMIGIGFRSLSMAPSAVAPVKAMIRSLKIEPLRQFMDRLYALSDHSVREKLRCFATDREIAV